MKVGPFFAVLLALLFVIDFSVAEPKNNGLDVHPAGTRINPRFYVKGNQRSSSSDDAIVEDEVIEENSNDEDSDDKEMETYYSVSDNSGQTYLIPENVLQAMADKQSNNDNSETVLVPNGSVDLDDDEESDNTDSDSAIVLNQESDDDYELEASPQFITIVNDSETYGKSPRRPIRRSGGIRRRRAGGRRNRRKRGGSRQGLIRRVTRRRIRRGGGARGGRRGGRRGAGGRVQLGRVRLRPRRRGVRFGF